MPLHPTKLLDKLLFKTISSFNKYIAILSRSRNFCYSLNE
jgi:hypothetical protein